MNMRIDPLPAQHVGVGSTIYYSRLFFGGGAGEARDRTNRTEPGPS